MEDINNKSHQLSNEHQHLLKGKLKIISLPSLTTTYVSHTLKFFCEQYPNISIEIKKSSPQEIKKMVDNPQIDLAFSTSPFDNLDAIVLKEDEMLVISDTKLAINKKMTSSKLEETLIITKSAYETIKDNLPPHFPLDMNHILLVQNIDTLKNMVKDHIGLGIISNHPLQTSKDNRQIVSLEPTIKFKIGVYAHHLKNISPAASKFLNLLLELYSNE